MSMTKSNILDSKRKRNFAELKEKVMFLLFFSFSIYFIKKKM